MIIWLFSAFAAIVATIVGFFMATGLVLEQDDKESNQSTTVGFFTKVVATMIVLYGIANAVLYPVSSSNKTTRTSATIAQVTSHYGLKPDTQYPLKLGQRFAGTSGSMTVNGNFFFVHGSGSWAPATAISVGFALQGNSYILEIPTSKITFVQSNEAKSSVSIHIDSDINAGHNYVVREDYGSYHARVSFGWWYCHRTLEKSSISTTDNVSLPEVIQGAFTDGHARATITLSPEQYNLLLTGGNPAPSSTSR